jgi:hypothetical protein
MKSDPQQPRTMAMSAIADRHVLKWGAVPVPYAALWSGEAGQMRVSTCPHTGYTALCDHEGRGTGRPIFGKPHMNRQREVIAKQCCDLCARPLAGRTKVSLSHATFRVSGALGGCIMQVEPLVHKDCALACVRYCPSLKRDIAAGTLFVRQVHQHRAQFAILTEAAVEEFCGVRLRGVVGHAKVELQRWTERNLGWLEAGRG